MQAAPEAPRARARRLPAEERRRQLIDAAVDVFARMGFSAAGTADIAAAAGIGEPTIYRYFENKRDLYIAAVAHGSDEIIEEWQRIVDDAADELVALQRIGIWYFQRLQERPQLLLLRSRSISDSGDDEIATVVREQYVRVLRFVEDLFDRAQRRGLIARDADAKTMMWLFMAVGSLLDQTVLLGLQDELTPEQVIRMAQMIQPQPASQ
jgi:AcrR family transcriptional regulator